MPPRKSPYLTPWPERSGTSEWGYSVWLNDSFCAGFASVSVWETKFRADIASFPVSLPSPSPGPCGSKRGKRPRDKPERGSRLTGQVQFSRFPTTSVYDARGVAQTGSAFGSGPKGQGFKSLHPDQLSQRSRCPQGQRIFCFKAGVKEWSTSWYGRSSGGRYFPHRSCGFGIRRLRFGKGSGWPLQSLCSERRSGGRAGPLRRSGCGHPEKTVE